MHLEGCQHKSKEERNKDTSKELEIIEKERGNAR